MLTKSTKEGADVDDVRCRIRIEDDGIIQVGGDALETIGNLIDGF